MHISDVEEFVDIVLSSGDDWDGKGEDLRGSFVFACCNDSNEYRQCSACGPIVLANVNQEIQLQKLNHLQCYGCTHIGDKAGELVLFLHDGAMIKYTEVFPGFVRPMLSYIYGDGTLSM